MNVKTMLIEGAYRNLISEILKDQLSTGAPTMVEVLSFIKDAELTLKEGNEDVVEEFISDPRGPISHGGTAEGEYYAEVIGKCGFAFNITCRHGKVEEVKLYAGTDDIFSLGKKRV